MRVQGSAGNQLFSSFQENLESNLSKIEKCVVKGELYLLTVNDQGQVVERKFPGLRRLFHRGSEDTTAELDRLMKKSIKLIGENNEDPTLAEEVESQVHLLVRAAHEDAAKICLHQEEQEGFVDSDDFTKMKEHLNNVVTNAIQSVDRAKNRLSTESLASEPVSRGTYLSEPFAEEAEDRAFESARYGTEGLASGAPGKTESIEPQDEELLERWSEGAVAVEASLSQPSELSNEELSQALQRAIYFFHGLESDGEDDRTLSPKEAVNEKIKMVQQQVVSPLQNAMAEWERRHDALFTKIADAPNSDMVALREELDDLNQLFEMEEEIDTIFLASRSIEGIQARSEEARVKIAEGIEQHELVESLLAGPTILEPTGSEVQQRLTVDRLLREEEEKEWAGRSPRRDVLDSAPDWLAEIATSAKGYLAGDSSSDDWDNLLNQQDALRDRQVADHDLLSSTETKQYNDIRMFIRLQWVEKPNQGE